MSELSTAGLDEILNADGGVGGFAQECAAISARFCGLVTILAGLTNEPIDDTTAALVRELAVNGVHDFDDAGKAQYFQAEFAALHARLDILDKLLIGTQN